MSFLSIFAWSCTNPMRHSSIIASDRKRRIGTLQLVALVAELVNNLGLDGNAVTAFQSYISVETNVINYRIHFPSDNSEDLVPNPTDPQRLRNVLEGIDRTGDIVHLIPLAQRRWKNHWTLLMLQGSTATLLDPTNPPVRDSNTQRRACY